MRSSGVCYLLLLVASCGSPTVHDTVTVAAAASLTDAFEAITQAFEAEHPDLKVRLNFGGSSALREQILGGAPTDVFASANMANMEQLVGAGAIDGAPVTFATNVMALVTPPDNPGAVTGLEDLAEPRLLIGLCTEEVPCGSLARGVLENVGVEPSLDTNEPDVRSLLTKVEAGELDAAIVYLTDVVAGRGAVHSIPIPAEINEETSYPIAVTAEPPNLVGANSFIAFVTSDQGRSILSDFGFGPP